MLEDFDRCYRAVQSKDARFDGWFFTAVTSTGIYCRPSCPALTPRAANVRFYATAAAAQQAGFRACKRCRPDVSPGSPEWDTRADVVGRAMRLVADGIMDREGLPGLARALGYSPRQVERLLAAELGAGPAALARAQRAQSARLLMETTDLSAAEVAFGAGFSSIRQFNDTVRAVFALTPTELRRRARRLRPAGPGPGGEAPGVVDLRLALRGPFEPDSLFGHLAATAVPGCEEVRDGAYRRTLRLAHGPGIVSLSPRPDHVHCRLHLADLKDLTAAIARARRLLDLDADPVAVAECLGADPELAGPVAKAPGRRIPRTVDEAEMALRAVLGQQVSVSCARTHAGRLVAALGQPVVDPGGGLSRLFPEPGAVAELDPAALALPRARGRTLVGLAAALAEGRLDVGPGADRARARSELGALAGIGPWTVEIIALRALGDPDAFPAGDLGVRRGAAALGLPQDASGLVARAQSWRPWRGYAVQYLWAALAHPINAGLGPARPQENECPTS